MFVKLATKEETVISVIQDTMEMAVHVLLVVLIRPHLQVVLQ